MNIRLLASVVVVATLASTARADLIHRYNFDTDASDSIGSADGTFVGSTMGGPTVSGGQLQLNNNTFQAASATNNYLSLPASILPSSGSVTIEQWGTYNGSGFFTEAWAFSDRNGGANPPGADVGQYLMFTISAPQPATPPGGAGTGGSHIAQATAGYNTETDAYHTTAGIGAAGGGGYLDDNGTYMTAAVIDSNAGTLSYYLYRVSDGAGGLQQTISADPLSSYSFTDAFLGRSPFDADNATAGSIDEFRIYNEARDGSTILADYLAGPNELVPEPTSLAVLGLGGLLGLFFRRRRS